MRSVILYFALCLSVLAQTSEVRTVKGWTRTHVMGLPGGELRDPTGTIADSLRYATSEASVTASSNLVESAHTGLTNVLARLYAATNRIDEFSNRIYIAADMDDDPGYLNIWSAVIGESVAANGTLHYFCYYSKELAAPPKTRWAFEVADGLTFWADGSVSTNNITTNYNGYACYDISVVPPPAIGNVVLRTNKFMLLSAAGYPLDIADAGINLIVDGVSAEPFTGEVVYTNVLGSEAKIFTEVYQSGTFYQITTNSIGL